MDVSSIFTTNTDTDTDVPPPPHKTTRPIIQVPDHGPIEPDMTPVQRIRAFRDGTLDFPDITGDDETENADNENADEEISTEDTDPTDTEPPAENGQHTPPDDDPNQETPPSPFTRWIDKNRKPLAIAGTLLAAGAVITAIVPQAHDETSHKVTARIPPHTSAPATSTAPAGDQATMPASVDVGREDCAVGSTPPMDAFNPAPGEHRTAWICQRPYGAPGTTMTITLPTPTTITEISSVPGFDGKTADGTDTWPQYQLVAAATWYFDNGSPKLQRFTTKRETQTVTFDPPVITKTIRLVINETVDVPPAQASSPTTTTPGLLGGLQDWGQQLGGTTTPAPLPPGGPTTGSPTPTHAAFAMGSIQIIGHPAR